METQQLLDLARQLMNELTFCVAATQGEDGDTNARVVQPLPVQDDWTVNVITNRRCRKVRDIERSGRLTLLYQALTQTATWLSSDARKSSRTSS